MLMPQINSNMLKNECKNQLGCPKSGVTSNQCQLGCASYNEVLQALTLERWLEQCNIIMHKTSKGDRGIQLSHKW